MTTPFCVIRGSLEEDLCQNWPNIARAVVRTFNASFGQSFKIPEHHLYHSDPRTGAANITSEFSSGRGHLLWMLYEALEANHIRPRDRYHPSLTSWVQMSEWNQRPVSSTVGGITIVNVVGQQPDAPLAAPMSVSTPVVQRPSNFASRMTRQKGDMQKVLAENQGLLLRISLGDISRIKSGEESIQAEVMFFPSQEDAAERADEIFQDDIKQANGDESAVTHGYLVCSGTSWHAASAPDVKSRGRALKKPGSTA